MWVWEPLFESSLWELGRLEHIEATEAPVLVLISLCPALLTLRILELWGCQSILNHIQCSCLTPTSPPDSGNETPSEGRPSRPRVMYLKWMWKSVSCLLFSCWRFRRCFFFFFPFFGLFVFSCNSLFPCVTLQTQWTTAIRGPFAEISRQLRHISVKARGENSKWLFIHTVRANAAKSTFCFKGVFFCWPYDPNTWCGFQLVPHKSSCLA